MNKAKKGFTLVELMISVAIIGLLAAIAIPAMQKYIIKSKFSGSYVMIRKMYDGAVLESSKTMGTEKDFFSGRILTCAKQFTFGSFHSYIIDDSDRELIGPPSGKKDISYFDKLEPSGFFQQTVEPCIIRNASKDLGSYGLNINDTGTLYALADPSYFAFANLVSRELATSLQSEGKNAVYSTGTGGATIYKTNTLWVYADIDGDYNPEYNEEDEEYNAGLPNFPNNRSDRVHYIMRGIYLDTVTGDVVGSAGIYEENIGE